MISQTIFRIVSEPEDSRKVESHMFIANRVHIDLEPKSDRSEFIPPENSVDD